MTPSAKAVPYTPINIKSVPIIMQVTLAKSFIFHLTFLAYRFENETQRNVFHRNVNHIVLRLFPFAD